MTDQTTPQELVRLYLRAQNLEHVQQTDEAVVLYEQAVECAFDACGPYDRLIAIYRDREAHAEVIRITGAALERVRTFEDKRAWYERIRDDARQALPSQPDHRGAEF